MTVAILHCLQDDQGQLNSNLTNWVLHSMTLQVV